MTCPWCTCSCRQAPFSCSSHHALTFTADNKGNRSHACRFWSLTAQICSSLHGVQRHHGFAKKLPNWPQWASSRAQVIPFTQAQHKAAQMMRQMNAEKAAALGQAPSASLTTAQTNDTLPAQQPGTTKHSNSHALKPEAMRPASAPAAVLGASASRLAAKASEFARAPQSGADTAPRAVPSKADESRRTEQSAEGARPGVPVLPNGAPAATGQQQQQSSALGQPTASAYIKLAKVPSSEWKTFKGGGPSYQQRQRNGEVPSAGSGALRQEQAASSQPASAAADSGALRQEQAASSQPASAAAGSGPARQVQVPCSQPASAAAGSGAARQVQVPSSQPASATAGNGAWWEVQVVSGQPASEAAAKPKPASQQKSASPPAAQRPSREFPSVRGNITPQTGVSGKFLHVH